MFNSFGNIFRLTSFGESHGKGVGGVIDGFPAGITIDEEFVQQELNRRRPGQSILTTPRKEADKVEFLSGIFEGKSTGCPIGFIVWNENQHSNDYNNLKVINSGGIKLFPELIEQKLVRSIPGRFFITSRPDEVLGESVLLALEGVHWDFVSLQLLLQKIRPLLGRFELPKAFVVSPFFRETTSGKVVRTYLA